MNFLPNVEKKQLESLLKEIKTTKSEPKVSSWLDSLGSYHDMQVPYRSGYQTKEALLNRARSLITNEQEAGSNKDANEAIQALRASQRVKLGNIYSSDTADGNYGLVSTPIKLDELQHIVRAKLNNH